MRIGFNKVAFLFPLVLLLAGVGGFLSFRISNQLLSLLFLLLTLVGVMVLGGFVAALLIFYLEMPRRG